jgi:hypothetical protein
MVKDIINKNIIVFFISMMCLGAAYPFLINRFFFGEYSAIVTLSFCGLWLLYCILTKNISEWKKIDKAFLNMTILHIIFLFVWGIVMEDEYYWGVMYSLITSLILIFLLINTIGCAQWTRFFTLFNIVMVILMVVGLTLFMTGYLPLISQFQLGNGQPVYNYGLFFTKPSWDVDNVGYTRTGGYYDEPGSLSYIVIFLLLLNQKYFKNKYWEYILLILPLFSASLAHIINCLIYMICFYFSPKLMKYFFVSCLTLIILINIVETYKKDYPFLQAFYDRTYGRVENIISTGEDNGSRDGGIEWGPKIFERYQFGVTLAKVRKDYPDFVHETFWGPILYYGIFGYFFYILPFGYILIRCLNTRDVWTFKFLILVLINLLQRPYYQYPLLMILMYILFFDNKVLKTQNSFKH